MDFIRMAFFTSDLPERSLASLVDLVIAKLKSNPSKRDKKQTKKRKEKRKTSHSNRHYKTNNTYSQCPEEVKVVKV